MNLDLDEMEVSLGYLEDWKQLIKELRAAREVVEAFRNADTVYPHSCTDSKSCYLCRANDAYDEATSS